MRSLASRSPAASSSRVAPGQKAMARPSVSPLMDQAKIAATTFASAALLLSTTAPAFAVGLESVDLPALPQSESHKEIMKAQQDKASANDEAFKKSDTLKRLLEKTEANKKANKTAIENKYCYRQAELGIGDCGGLKLIPGMTDSGKQKTPDWLAGMLGVEQEKEEAGDGTPKNIRDFFKDVTP